MDDQKVPTTKTCPNPLVFLLGTVAGLLLVGMPRKTPERTEMLDRSQPPSPSGGKQTMEAQELPEYFEDDTPRQGVQVESIRLTTAVVAVLMGTCTLLSHRSHTKHVILETHANREWSSYEARHLRAREYAALADLAAMLPKGRALATKNLALAIEDECGRPPEKNCSDSLTQTSIVSRQLSAANDRNNKPEAARSTLTLEKPSPGSNTAPPKEGATAIQRRAIAAGEEAAQEARQADFYDAAQLFFGISLVLCAITLLSKQLWYWRISYIGTFVGLAVSVCGYLIRRAHG